MTAISNISALTHERVLEYLSEFASPKGGVAVLTLKWSDNFLKGQEGRVDLSAFHPEKIWQQWWENMIAMMSNDDSENEYDNNDEGDNERVCERECARELQ